MTKLRFRLVSFCVLLFALSAMAQIQSSQFTGTITDGSGAALAGAKVTMTNQATNFSVTTTTNGTRSPRAQNVNPYKWTLKSSNFKELVRLSACNFVENNSC